MTFTTQPKRLTLKTPMRLLTMAALTVTLSGCLSTENVVQETSRAAAKRVVNGVISQKFPGVDAAPYTDCVIENASTDEIVTLAKGAVTGDENAAVSTVLEIAGRPATSSCIAQSALGSVLGGI